MPSLKEVRIRIHSVGSTQQITKAMKMVAAAKLRRAQDAVIQLRPYAGKLQEILSNLSANLDEPSINIYSKERTLNKILLVVITSNKGLCGGFNSNVIKTTKQLIEKDFSTQNSQGNIDVICIGKKAYDFFKKYKCNLVAEHNQIFNKIEFENIAKIAETLTKDYINLKYDKIILIYNQFKNAASQILTKEQYLPIVKSSVKKESKLVHDYIFDPSQDHIVQELIPKSLKIKLYKAILDSNAAEHGARMTAMDKATENASDLLKELKISYNKARQATITKEILEIVGGAECLSN